MPCRIARRAMTLVELLVVVGLIAVLLALLMPALHLARGSADRTLCLANLRQLGHAMLIYTLENDDYLPGSPNTTARHLWRDNAGTWELNPGVSPYRIPGDVIDLYDYVGPLSRVLQLHVPATEDGTERLRAYRQMRVFLCPAARGVLATPYDAPLEAEAGPMLGYCTASAFMLIPFRGGSASGWSGTAAMPGDLPHHGPYWTAPQGYVPKLSRIGATSGKVFLADSGRWSRYDTAPTFSLTVGGNHNFTMFSDFGPFWGISKSYDRCVPNGMNLKATRFDARVFAYRHGTRQQRQPTGRYRLNAAFYDGHAETLDEMASADPDLWLPRGTAIGSADAWALSGPIVWPDVAARYLPGVSPSRPHRVP